MAETNGTAGVNGVAQVDISVALAANDASAVKALIKEISVLGESFPAGNDQDRLRLLAKAKSLWQALETPRETMIRHNWAQPSAHVALTAGRTTGVWDYLAKQHGSFKASEAGEAVNVDPPLMSRLMRHICAMGYLKEVGADTYELTNFTRSMSIPIIGDGYPCIAGGGFAALNKFHEWEEKRSWKTPKSMTDGPYQYAYDTELNFFEYLQAHPPYGEQFNYHMGGYRQGRPAWMDAGFYPVKENLIDGFEDSQDSALLVDIGGSIGHDLQEFHQKHTEAPGRLVLQDLPAVIGQIVQLDDKVERMEYDFTTEQPVKGARAYYLHSILHDWPDEMCLKILANIKAAMKPGYSKLLINENVIPATNAQWEATALDMMMLTLFSSRERTAEDWQDLVTGAGLKIVKIWSVASGVESIVECELA